MEKNRGPSNKSEIRSRGTDSVSQNVLEILRTRIRREYARFPPDRASENFHKSNEIDNLIITKRRRIKRGPWIIDREVLDLSRDLIFPYF